MIDDRTQQRLERIKNRRTLYELAMSHPDGRRYLIAYAARKGRAGIWNAVTNDARTPKLVALTGGDGIHFAKRADDGATMGEWTIRFTGRTERECILGSDGPELPYIGDV